MSQSHLFTHALLPDGWSTAVRITSGDNGLIQSVQRDAQPQPGEVMLGPVIAGIANAHSHAFQRLMAGLTEHRVTHKDSFWSWRDTMYRFAADIEPDQLQAIAAQLYVEMLKAGYTSVAEFHYLHHATDGTDYAPVDLMSAALLDGARQAGIGMTLLPVLYSRGGFDGRPLNSAQRRFGCDNDRFTRLLEALGSRMNPADPQRLGIAVHSLRAVASEGVAKLAESASGPLHIHIAEQPQEVADCQAATGQTPVQFLLSGHDVNQRWTLVHATHMSEAETEAVAASGATVALCPTTEANLGDGVFDLPGFIAAGGRLAIGSDSQISIDPREELRWLEYAQRLRRLERNVVSDDIRPNTGQQLVERCQEGGRIALGQPIGRIERGSRADLLVLDDDHPMLAHTPVEQLLDSWVFCGAPLPPRHVMVAGRWLVRNGRHFAEASIRAAWDTVARPLRLNSQA